MRRLNVRYALAALAIAAGGMLASPGVQAFPFVPSPAMTTQVEDGIIAVRE